MIQIFAMLIFNFAQFQFGSGGSQWEVTDIFCLRPLLKSSLSPQGDLSGHRFRGMSCDGNVMGGLHSFIHRE